MNTGMAGDCLGKLSYRVKMDDWDVLAWQERGKSVAWALMTNDSLFCLLESVVVQIGFEPISFSLVAWES